MRHISIFLPVVIIVLSGCEPQTDEPSVLPPPLMDGSPMVKVGRRTKMEPRRYSLLIRLRMASVEVPVGMASGSEEIWSYLNEEPVAAVNQSGLGRNGFRIGVGRGESWADLARVLSRMTGRELRQSSMLAPPGNPVQIELKRLQPVQTIFTFRNDRTLCGRDYPPGDNLLTICSTLDEDDPSTVLITGVPQVRSTGRRPQIVNDGAGGLRMVEQPVLFSLSPLTFQVSIPAGSLLVIGPGSASRRPTSAGHHFLVHRKKGVEFETVLVVIPEVFATPLPEPGEP